MPTLKALMLEDRKEDVDIASESLRRAAPDGIYISLDHVETVADAHANLAARNYDIVLCDLGLPESLGVDTFTALQKGNPGVPVIILSSSGGLEDAASCVEAGAAEYVPKDNLVGPGLLHAMIFALLRSKAGENHPVLRTVRHVGQARSTS